MAARLKETYLKQVIPALTKEFGYKNVMAVPRLDKISINIGMGEATQNAKAAGVTGLVEFRREDLFKADFRDATVVTLYLHPDLNVKLRPRLWAELKPGTRIVSHQFGMGDWVPEKTLELNGRTIYFWTVPDTGKKS